MTADELLAIAMRDKPHVRYTKNHQGTALAGWNGTRWETVAMRVFKEPTGAWVSVGDLFIDGKPCNDPADWVEEGV